MFPWYFSDLFFVNICNIGLAEKHQTYNETYDFVNAAAGAEPADLI